MPATWGPRIPEEIPRLLRAPASYGTSPVWAENPSFFGRLPQKLLDLVCFCLDSSGGHLICDPSFFTFLGDGWISKTRALRLLVPPVGIPSCEVRQGGHIRRHLARRPRRGSDLLHRMGVEPGRPWTPRKTNRVTNVWFCPPGLVLVVGNGHDCHPPGGKTVNKCQRRLWPCSPPQLLRGLGDAYHGKSKPPNARKG